MSPDTWYVLRVSPRDETLLRCSPDGHEAVSLPARPRSSGEIDQQITSDRVQDASPYAPEGAQKQAEGEVPRATRVVDDPVRPKDGREAHFRHLGEQVRRARRDQDGPLVVAMDESAASLFEAVAGTPVRQVIMDADSASPEALWRQSRDVIT